MNRLQKLTLFAVWIIVKLSIIIVGCCLLVELRMRYLSIKETANKWGLSGRRVQILCAQGRLDGVIRIGSTWGIPETACKPADARIKSGRYIKSAKSLARDVEQIATGKQDK